jgi:hypothetical protein
MKKHGVSVDAKNALMICYVYRKARESHLNEVEWKSLIAFPPVTYAPWLGLLGMA